MKPNNRRRIAAVLLTLTVLAGVCSGCGGKKEEPAAPAPTKGETEAVIHVSSIEELMDNLRSGAKIEIASGTYNITEWAEKKLESSDYEVWQDEHPEIQFEYDTEGPAVLFFNLEDISIRGEGNVHLQTEPRYYDVLAFNCCDGVALENMMLGHNAEKGYCTGGVVKLENTVNATLKDLDLYGCGTYGVTTNNSNHVTVENCTIHDCSYGMVDSMDSSDILYKDCVMKNCEDMWMICPGDSSLTFENCTFTDNTCGDPFLPLSSGIVRFLGCTFGAAETEALQAVAGCGGYAFDGNCKFDGQAPRRNVTVGSVEELVEAIEPNVTLWMEPGKYNLTPWLGKIWAAQGQTWNNSHTYMDIVENYDGLGLVLTGVYGLGIFGVTGNPDDVEIVVEPRYADVLGMEGCFDMALFGLTMGHTKTGDCVGDVVRLTDCSDIALGNMDLYGCGVYGLTAEESQNVLVFDSKIHDCSYGPVNVQECYNTVAFNNVDFVDSDGGFSLWNSDEYLNICFYRCSFGTEESNSLYFRDDVYVYNCEWSEITEYPDYSDYDWYDELDPTTDMLMVELTDELLLRSAWYGVQGLREGTSYSLADEDICWTLLFWEDGTGTLDGYYDKPVSFDWEILDGGYVAQLTFEDDYGEAYTSIYAEETGSEPLLELQITDDLVWMAEAVG